MTERSLSQWLQELEARHPTEIELGLDRVTAVAQQLGLLPFPATVITVAGTNGKGSVAAVCEAGLVAAGTRVGVYTSPHFLVFNERIRIDGLPVPDGMITDAFASIDAARANVSLTYFEMATLAALVVFARVGVEMAVLEVGLGGRLDAVNIVDPTVAVITRIDLDHQDWLGDTRELIGAEKAGILRSNSPAVIADREPPDSLLRPGAASQYLVIGRDWQSETSGAGHKLQLQAAGEALPLMLDGPASLHAENVGAALQALLLAGVDITAAPVLASVSALQVTGRLQHVAHEEVDVVMDVAHNPAAVHKLHEHLISNPCEGRTIALFNAMSDKDLHGMIRACGEGFDAWFLADLPGVARAARASDLAAIVHESGGHMISVSKNVTQAWRRVFTLLQTGDRLVVFGSFFTVAAALACLQKDRAKQARHHTA